MKKLVITFTLFICITPSALFAQSPYEQYRSSLLLLIELLQRQVNMLTAQILNIEVSSVEVVIESPKGEEDEPTIVRERKRRPNISVAVYQSEFYDGKYVAIYDVIGDDLRLRYGTRDSDDVDVWELFTRIAGTPFIRTYFSEYRIYDNANAATGAFVDQLEATNKGILGVNVADVDLDDSRYREHTIELLMHEYSHTLFHNDPQIVEVFRGRFWDEEDMRHAERIAGIHNTERREDSVYKYYTDHRADFVTDYAANSPLEDLAESFTYFVQNAAPKGLRERDEKVHFFYDYPEIVNIRERIRKDVL